MLYGSGLRAAPFSLSESILLYFPVFALLMDVFSEGHCLFQGTRPSEKIRQGTPPDPFITRRSLCIRSRGKKYFCLCCEARNLCESVARRHFPAGFFPVCRLLTADIVSCRPCRFKTGTVFPGAVSAQGMHFLSPSGNHFVFSFVSIYEGSKPSGRKEHEKNRNLDAVPGPSARCGWRIR